jgi:hypothetical protein
MDFNILIILGVAIALYVGNEQTAIGQSKDS